jgi:Domain of unknown function (DUF4157)
MFAPKVARTKVISTSRTARRHPSVAQQMTGQPGVAWSFGRAPISAPDQSGEPLDTSARGEFQTQFVRDFSSVRVHTDEQAAASAASLSARAYTIGKHVVFGRGEYTPGTIKGRRLLAHELAHVVQQGRHGSDGTSDLEAAADRAANQAAHGKPIVVAGSAPVGIALKTLFEDFSGGKYSFAFLKLALEHTRPVTTIVDDLNALTSTDRDQAIKDLVLERGERSDKQADLTTGQASQTDPKLQAVFGPMLQEGQRVLGRMDAVLDGLGVAGAARKPVESWNFTPGDYARLRANERHLTMAPDSNWFPAQLQENLLRTLAFVLAGKLSPSATEGVNAMDFFHGHLVIKKDAATNDQAKVAGEAADKVEADVTKATVAAFGNMSYGRGGYHVTGRQIGAYTKGVEQVEPSLATVLQDTSKIPGAAVMYHTFEFNQPRDAKASGVQMGSDEPRRQYVTPLDTNTPRQYTPPAGGYEKEFTHITRFSFLVDNRGAVHVRPFGTSTNFTSLELSTITGSKFPEPFEPEKVRPH